MMAINTGNVAKEVNSKMVAVATGTTALQHQAKDIQQNMVEQKRNQ
jgi:hypothetical protein